MADTMTVEEFMTPGLVTPGNIDLSKRPVRENPDGTFSTVVSKSFNIEGKETLIPTLNPETGKRMSDEEALDYYKKTGQHMGIFSSPEAATEYAKRASAEQEKLHQNTMSVEDFMKGTEAPRKQAEGALGTAVNMLKAAGGEAAALIDLVASLPGFALQVGGSIGGTIGAAAAGVPLGVEDQRALNPVTAYTVGRETGHMLSEPFMSPLAKVLNMFQSGEVYEKSKVSGFMNKFASMVEDAGKWVETVTNGQIPRDSVAMLVDTAMMAAVGRAGARKPSPINKAQMEDFARAREEYRKSQQQAEAETAPDLLTPEEFAARVPVQQQINDTLGILPEAERAKRTARMRSDVNAAFAGKGKQRGLTPEEQYSLDVAEARGTRFYESYAEMEQALDERTRQEALLRGDMERRARAEEAARSYELGSKVETDPITQADMLRILGKPGWERTAEDLITLREARRRAEDVEPYYTRRIPYRVTDMSAEYEARMNAAEQAWTKHVEAFNERRNQRIMDELGTPEMQAADAAARDVLERLRTAVAKQKGGMWHPEAVERLAEPLEASLRTTAEVMPRLEADPNVWAHFTKEEFVPSIRKTGLSHERTGTGIGGFGRDYEPNGISLTRNKGVIEAYTNPRGGPREDFGRHQVLLVKALPKRVLDLSQERVSLRGLKKRGAYVPDDFSEMGLDSALEEMGIDSTRAQALWNAGRDVTFPAWKHNQMAMEYFAGPFKESGDALGAEVRQKLMAQGYDAVKYPDELRVLDPSVLKEERSVMPWGAVEDLSNTGLVKVSKDLQKRYDLDPYATREEVRAKGLFPESGLALEHGGPRARRAPPAQAGFIDQKLLMGLGALGLGGLIGSWFTKEPQDGALLGALAGGALMFPGVRARFAQSVKGVDYLIGSLSTRIGNVSPSVKMAARAFEMRNLERAYEYLHRVAPFMQELEKVKGPARLELERAILTNDPAVIDAAMKGNAPLVTAWRQTRTMLNEIGKQLQGYGRFKSMREEYFPRLVKDLEGLKKALDQPLRTRLETALQEAERKALKSRGTPLTDIERSAIVNKELQAVRRAQGFQPGYAKPRRVKEIDERIQPFYYTPAESLYAYTRSAVQDLEMAKFFGRDLVQTEKGGQYYINIDQSVGNLIGRELKKGKITYEQARQLEDMLKSRFKQGERGSSRVIQDLRNLGNMGLLGNIVAGVTQGADAMLALYAHDLRSTLTAAGRIFSGKAKIRAKDFGLADHIAEEFVSSSRSAKWLNTMFKLSGFTAIDRFGKDVQLGAAHSKLTRWSQTAAGRAKIAAKYKEAYGPEYDQFISDLQQGSMSGRVRAALFSELSDMQPISRLEMPQGYLDHPNGRIMYMLKTFMLKQMDVVRRDSYNEIRKGNVAKGLKNLTEYALILGISGATTDMVKDWLMGRQVQFTATDVLENALKTFGWSEYFRAKLKEGRPAEALVGAAAPPYRIMDDIIRRDPKAVQYIPLIGKLIYSWELGGRERSEIAQKRVRGGTLSERAKEWRREQAQKRREERQQ